MGCYRVVSELNPFELLETRQLTPLSYTEALQCPTNTDLESIIKGNRALCFLQIGMLDAALEELSYPFDGPVESQVEKTLFLTGRALYALQRSRESSDVLSVLCRNHAKNEERQKLLARSVSRLLEETRFQGHAEGSQDSRSPNS